MRFIGQEIKALKNMLTTNKFPEKFDIKTDEIKGYMYCIAEEGKTYSGDTFLQPVTNFMKYEELAAFIIGVSKAPYFTT